MPVAQQTAGSRRILVIASLSWSLLNFRGQLLADMVRHGHDVVAAAPDADPEVAAALAALGVRLVQIPMQRTARNILADCRTLAALVRLLRQEAPDTVLAYTQKPIVYGGLAARIVGGMQFHAMVSGLGYAFTNSGSGRPSWSGRALQLLVAALYRTALAGARTVFVFNSDDEQDMRRNRMLPAAVPVIQVPGSGVDIARFAATPVPVGPPSFLMVARLLVHKGVREFAEAARMVRAEFPNARFQLLGPPDPNPAGLPAPELDALQREGVIEYLGHTRDVAPYLAAASVFVLPTWYREGLPRTILEAMASGRAVVTTDAPGCRDAVVHGETGLLVPVRDPVALGAALLRLARDPGLVDAMGHAGRARAETVYDVDLVNRQLLHAMGLHRLDEAPAATAMQPRSSPAPAAREAA